MGAAAAGAAAGAAGAAPTTVAGGLHQGLVSGAGIGPSGTAAGAAGGVTAGSSQAAANAAGSATGNTVGASTGAATTAATKVVEKAVESGVVSKVGEVLLDNAGRIIGTSAAVIAAIAEDSGDDSNTQPVGDPASGEFWDGFVDDWMGKNGKSAKDMYAEDDAFIKSKVEPAVGEYQAVLSELANQARTGTGNYKPITYGMGDFRSSFVPKSGLRVASDLKNYGKDTLTSELALTDVMQPNKGNLSYLDKLTELAKYDRNFNLSKWAAENGFNLDQQEIDNANADRGTWLDAVTDILKVGNASQDVWDKLFDKD